MATDADQVLERFSRSYADRKYESTTIVRHNGTAIAMAMDDQRRIVYLVLDVAGHAADKGGLAFDADAWFDEPVELPFPTEIAQVGFGVAGSHALPVHRQGSRRPEPAGTPLPPRNTPGATFQPDYFLSTTARLTELAPFHALSDGRYVYVFRQALPGLHPEMVHIDQHGRILIRSESDELGHVNENGQWIAAEGEFVPIVDATLLVDRFVLVGTSLQPTVEARYQRSRSKTRPQSHADSLGPRDLDGNLFHEPTHELSFVRHLSGGRFTALLVPTQVAGTQRWQIFAHNDSTGHLDSFSIERSSDGLFNTRGSPTYTCPDHPTVFSLVSGECSEPTRDQETCGQSLVPRVSASGHAEAALRFSSSDAAAGEPGTGWVELSGGLAGRLLGEVGELTIEAWVRPEPTGELPLQVLVAGGAPLVANAGLWIWIVDGVRLRIGFGDGQQWNQVTTAPVLAPHTWNHLAVTLSARPGTGTGTGTLRVFVDGFERARTTEACADEAEQEPHELVRGPVLGQVITSIGGGAGPGFVGTIDEVRLWNRTRGEREIRAAKDHRLTGFEPGLVAYWRFDEATGELAADATELGNDGVVRGATWARSDAPVGDHPGFTRDSSRLIDSATGVGRSVLSPPAALLYFQQSLTTGGYSGSEKPMKHAGRVMVAVSTDSGNPDETAPLIAVLDVGVAPSGRLAQLPDVIELRRIDAGTELRSELASIDAAGLTTWSALLGFTGCADGAFLLDGSDGKIALFFRDINGRFVSVAYFDTFTEPVRIGLTDQRGVEVASCLGSPALNAADLTIEVDDGDASTCTVTITSAGLQERWTAVPRARTKLARVLNGEAGTDYDFAGAVTIGAAPGNESSQARLLVPPAGLPTGSLLVRATTTPDSAARGSDPTVVDQQRSSLTHGARGWTAATPGQALRVGKGCFASAPPTVPGARFDAVDDMTMEVWLQPQLGVGRGRLAERRAATVFRFEPDGFVQIDVAPHLDVAGTITIEAWVRIDKRPTNIRNIVAHGHRFDPDGEVFLRLEGQWDLRYQVGSWDGAEHLTSFPVPDEDIGHWVHLAGVYGGDTWRLYRNGMQVSSRQDGTGAVRVENTPWQIGASSVATDRRGLEGWVDEVRIWSSARTDDEILEHLGRPLADPENEPALVGYWCGSSGAKDLSSHDATCREVGRVRCENAVLPELFDAREGVSIMRHASASTSGERLRSYELRLEARRDQLASKRQRTVIVLNGNSHIQIDPAAQLNFAGNITLEAWVQIEKPIDGFRNIVAHGYRRAPDREVFLRVHNMHYEVGSCDGRDHLTTCSVDAADLGRWVHLAGVYDGTHWRLYRDGIEASSQADATGAVEVLDSHWNIGASTQRSDPRYFVGRVDDVRIWSTARTAEQIRDHLGDPLAAPEKETTLAGNWCGSSGAKDVSRHHGTCRVLGPVRYEPQELPELFYAPNGIWPVAQVKGLRARSTTPLQGWGHVAATYAQSFAMDLTRGEYLECGDDAGLDLTDDLTVEVFGQIDELVGGNGLLVKGTPAPGTDARVPYSLVVDGKGLLQFAFQDVDGVVHTFGAEKPIVPGSPFRVAASRKRQTSTVGQGIGTCVVVWHDIALRVEDANGSTFTTTRHYTHPKVTIVDGKPSIAASNQEHALEPAAVGGGAEHLVIGRGYLDLDEKRRVPLHGRVSEVRIWNAACESISARVSGGVSGLASYWRFAERAGPTVADSAGSAHARLIGAARWCRDPDPRGSTLRLYLDGVELPSRTEQFEGLPGEVPFVLFARQSASADGDDGFTGGIDELRLWRVVRTAKELRDNMFRRVIGEDSDQLIAYYPFEIAPAGENAPSGVVTLADRSGTGNDLELHAARFAPSDAPVGDEAPQVCNALAPVRTAYVETTRARPAVAEYGEMTTDATGKLVGVLKRCYSLVRPDGSWKLVAGFKVGDLTTEWVSQVQFAPQLIGYIEGAPPVPRENLGQRAVPGIGDIDDYNEASAVRLLEADSTRLTHSVSLDRGFDQQWDIALGAVLRAEGAAGFGYEQKLFETESFVGLHTKFENSYSWLEESIAEAVQTTRKETSLELRGRITPIGYLPDNVGLALVESETADLFALRLRRNNALVGYHLRPNADIPPDWNIVHFKLDPHYTKQGTLDGFVGNEPDDDYPNAGGSRSEASYYKPKEAYQLEQRIAEDEEAARMARFYDAAISAGPGGEALPDLTKRNIVNTYVWTADGGLFAETQEVMDSVHEVKGGAYKFLGMAGLKAELLFSAPAGMKFSLDALMGGHHNRVKSRTKEATHAFSLDVSVDKVERDIYERTGDGQLKESREPGKVDAYRFMTFYLEPSDRNFEDFFGRVVDPAWIELNDPAALTLRQLRDASEKPACWRVFHRVTFVSRVLRESDAEPRSLEEKLPRLDIDSNYELVRQLEPYLVPATWQTTAELRQAVEAALEAVHLEELLGNSAEIAEFMEQYLAARAPGAPAIEC